MINNEWINIKNWAINNQLSINETKTKVIQFHRPNTPCHDRDTQEEIIINGNKLKIMPSINILGIDLSSNLGIGAHVNSLIKKINKILFTMHAMKNRGMNQQNLYDIYNSLINTRMFYCSSSWTLLATKEDIGHLEKVVKKAVKWHYANPNIEGFIKSAESNSDKLFTNILRYDDHPLCHLLPEIKDTGHNTRKNRHDRILPNMTVPHDTCNFIFYQLFKHINI